MTTIDEYRLQVISSDSILNQNDIKQSFKNIAKNADKSNVKAGHGKTDNRKQEEVKHVGNNVENLNKYHFKPKNNIQPP